VRIIDLLKGVNLYRKGEEARFFYILFEGSLKLSDKVLINYDRQSYYWFDIS
jgi:hypothetical protein